LIIMDENSQFPHHVIGNEANNMNMTASTLL